MYDLTEGNRKWKNQDGGLKTSKTYISACTQDSNEIATALTYVFGVQLSNKHDGKLALFYDQTGRNRKWKFQDGGL